jgi:hypothetical protein
MICHNWNCPLSKNDLKYGFDLFIFIVDNKKAAHCLHGLNWGLKENTDRFLAYRCEYNNQIPIIIGKEKTVLVQSVQSTSSHLVSLRCSLTSPCLCLGFPVAPLLQVFWPKLCIHLSLFLTSFMPLTFNLSWFEQPNNIWQGALLLIMGFPPAPYCQTPPVYAFCECKRPCFTHLLFNTNFSMLQVKILSCFPFFLTCFTSHHTSPHLTSLAIPFKNLCGTVSQVSFWTYKLWMTFYLAVVHWKGQSSFSLNVLYYYRSSKGLTCDYKKLFVIIFRPSTMIYHG